MHNGNLHGLLPVLHRLDRWHALVRPVTSVRPVDRAGQDGGYSSRTTNLPESLSDFSRPWNQNTPKTHSTRKKNPSQTKAKHLQTIQEQHNPKTQESSNLPEANPTQGTHRSDRSLVPVTLGQLGMKNSRGSTPPKLTPDLSIRSTVSNKTLGIVGTPSGALHSQVMIHQNSLNQEESKDSTKNSSNPRTLKTLKSSTLTHGFWRGIKGKRTTKGWHIHPPPNPQEQGLENTPRYPPREGSGNHHQEQTGTTQPSLEEPRRIIYTYQRGSYKV
jgi:hypothetical protein